MYVYIYIERGNEKHDEKSNFHLNTCLGFFWR